MKRTNINITGVFSPMTYYFEYPETTMLSQGSLEYILSDNSIVMYTDGNNCLRTNNTWYDDSRGSMEDFCTDRYIPNTYKLTTIKFCLPEYSVDVYKPDILYTVDMYIWIHGKKISLGSRVLRRNESLALDKPLNINNETYLEYIPITIPDPYSIIYDDDWKEFRVRVCDKYHGHGESYEHNDIGSMLNISMHAVIKDAEMEHPVTEEMVQTYCEADDFRGGQNTINMSDAQLDYLSIRLTDNRNETSPYESRMLFKTEAFFNNVYQQDEIGFKEYLLETYGIESYTLSLELSIQDDEDVYKYINIDIDSPWCNIDVKKTFDEDGNKALMFSSWDGYKEGIFVRAYLHIKIENNDENEIYLTSNKIPLTEDLFRFLVDDGEIDINKVYLEAVDMNMYNINAVKKIQQTVVQVERPDDYKANIIKPVFFRTHSVGKIILHSGVIEQICINLDQYKSKVDTFILKIGDILFTEYSRTTAGVIFRIDGTSLEGLQQGTFYILNEENEMVTSGIYEFES